jgi:hypothetical protein
MYGRRDEGLLSAAERERALIKGWAGTWVHSLQTGFHLSDVFNAHARYGSMLMVVYDNVIRHMSGHVTVAACHPLAPHLRFYCINWHTLQDVK